MVQLFAQITKVDEARRRVTGVVTNSTPDHDDEIFDYPGSKPFFVEAAEEMRKASGGKNLMPVRENHTLKSSGHVVEIEFDDDAQKITATAEITDDGSWNKVLKGTLTGYSVNGRYIRRWPDAKSGGVYKRYIVQPISIDLADRPCVKGAYFDLMKVDGGTEQVVLVGDPDHHELSVKDMVQQVWACKTTGHEHFQKESAIECVLKTMAAKHQVVPPAVEDDIKEEVNKAAGDGEQEDEMDEKTIETMLQKTLSAGNEDLKKVFTTKVEEVQKTLKAEFDARVDEIEGAVEDLAKAFMTFMEAPAEEEKPPVLKAMDRAKDVGGGGEAGGPDDDEDDEDDVRKNMHVVRKPGLRKSLHAALNNPITFGTSRG